jgi:hypothetical protein
MNKKLMMNEGREVVRRRINLFGWWRDNEG